MSPVNLQHIFRIPFPKNTFGRLLLNIVDPFETSIPELFQAFDSTKHYRDQCMIVPEGTNSLIFLCQIDPVGLFNTLSE